jgi:hypothetical protein
MAFLDPIQSGSRPQKCSTALAIDQSGALAYPRLAPTGYFLFPSRLFALHHPNDSHAGRKISNRPITSMMQPPSS